MTIFTKTDGNSITLKKWSHLWKDLLVHSWHEFLMFIADWYVCILKSFLNRSSLSAEEVHWDVDWWTASPPLAGWGHTTRRSICRERRASFIPSVHKYLWNYALNVYIRHTYISHNVNWIKKYAGNSQVFVIEIYLKFRPQSWYLFPPFVSTNKDDWKQYLFWYPIPIRLGATEKLKWIYSSLVW